MSNNFDDFFRQMQTPLNMSELGKETLLGVPNIIGSHSPRFFFGVHRNVTVGDVLAWENPPSPYTVAEMKKKLILEDVVKLINIIELAFKPDVDTLGDEAVLYISKPLSFLDLAPGNVGLSYEISMECSVGKRVET